MSEGDARRRRFGRDVALRSRTARGTVVNAVFLTGVNLLAMSRGILMAGFLGPGDYGIWGILAVMMATLIALKQVGIGERFVQQDEADQQREFKRAFTLEMSVALLLLVVGAALIVAASLVYDIPELLAPGLVMVLTLPMGALQFSLAVFYRRMDFKRQRTLQAVDPIVAFAVTIGLAVIGVGYWALVWGTLAGAIVGMLVAIAASPYDYGWEWDRRVARSYASFSWPILLGSGAAVVTGQGLVAAGNASVGLHGIGIIALIAQVSQFADRADRAITETLYPAICAVKDRTDLFLESFVKSNRLALMWGVPFGAGVALFADDFLVRVLGPEWASGVLLLQMTAIALAIHQIGYNWTAFYRARGNTRPLAVAAAFSIATFCLISAPALLAWGLDGLAVAILVGEVIHTSVRGYFLKRMFTDFGFLRHIGRAIAPTAVAVASVLLVRLADGGSRTLAVAAGEFVVYAAATAAATWLLEKRLVKEIVGYLRARGAPAAGPA